MRELQLKFFCDRWEYPRMRPSRIFFANLGFLSLSGVGLGVGVGCDLFGEPRGGGRPRKHGPTDGSYNTTHPKFWTYCTKTDFMKYWPNYDKIAIGPIYSFFKMRNYESQNKSFKFTSFHFNFPSAIKTCFKNTNTKYFSIGDGKVLVTNVAIIK